MKIFSLAVNDKKINNDMLSTELEKEILRIKTNMNKNDVVDIRIERLG